MRLLFAGLLGLLLGAVSLAFAQTSIFFHIPQVMNPLQLAETGVSSLSEPQRKALDNWLNDYTRRVVTISATASSEVTYSGDGKHWVDEVCQDGAIVVLEDDSIWKVESTDRVDTALWLTTTNVTVKKASKATGEYDYVLRNTDDKETAHAKYLGEL